MTTIQRPSFLDPGGVEHNPHASAHGLGREVLGELSANGAGVSVGAGDLAPDDPHVGLLGLVGDGGLLLGLEKNQNIPVIDSKGTSEKVNSYEQ